MDLIIGSDRTALGQAAAECALTVLRERIASTGRARLVVATGSSQFELLDALVRTSDIDWSRVEGFHLDEYIGLSADHPASFCGYLRKRFVDLVPLSAFHFLDGTEDPKLVCEQVGALLTAAPIDLALVGIGENGHLAFNDPPADFETSDPYLIVSLDEACRRQQVGEGWFDRLEDVPEQAISMSVRQIMSARNIVCTVPDRRKAEAVAAAIEGPITPQLPASMLQQHPHLTMCLDEASASLLHAALHRAARRV